MRVLLLILIPFLSFSQQQPGQFFIATGAETFAWNTQILQSVTDISTCSTANSTTLSITDSIRGGRFVKGANAWTKFFVCYTEGSQPPVFLNTRSEWSGGVAGAGVDGGVQENILYGEKQLYNGGFLVDKYVHVGTTTFDAAARLKVYNDYTKTQSRVSIKNEGSTTEINQQFKNSTGATGTIQYIDSTFKIYSKSNVLAATIDSAGITANKFFGDGSALTGITGNGLGYTLSVQSLTSSPADAQTIYFGQLPKAPTTTANISKVYIRKAGTIKIAQIYTYAGTAGTAEAWVMNIRLNNTTDTQIASVALATNERIFTNSSLNIAVNAGDYIEIKCVNPTWVTNPLTFIAGGYIYIE